MNDPRMSVPQPDWRHLETERLILRPFVAADVEAYVAIRSKPSLHRYMPGGVDRTCEAKTRAPALIADWRSAWKTDGVAPWAVIERESGRLAGHLGLRRLEALDAVELLYLLDDWAHGRGYATEGGRAAIDFAEHRLALPRVIGLAHRRIRRRQRCCAGSACSTLGP